MRILPTRTDQRLSRIRVLADRWAEDPAAVGLTPEAVAEVQALLAEAEQSVSAASLARQQAQALTEFQDVSIRAASRAAQHAINTIKLFAQTADSAEVLKQALIPAPAEPSPPPPLEIARNFLADPLRNGDVVLTWNASTARGLFYAIERSIDGGPWQYLDAVSARRWTDKTVPLGSRHIRYRLYTKRNGLTSSNCAMTNVQFGTTVAAERAGTRSAA